MNNLKNYYLFFSWFFVITFGISYGVLPLVYFVDEYKDLAFFLSSLSVLSIIFYLIGLRIQISNNKINKKYFFFKFENFSFFIFVLYLITVITILATANNIPIIESIKGADVYQLLIFREMFLKDRQGWESVLSYVITIIDSAILPYVIMESFLRKFKYRYLFIGIFLLYSISFLEKAYIFKIVLPVFSLLYFLIKNKVKFITISSIIVFIIVFFMFSISKSDDSLIMEGSFVYPFFSLLYRPQNISEAILWRTIVIPITTALDGLAVFKVHFYNEYFMGRTSSLLSAITGQERLNFERFVYQSQFGGSETGNANQTFIIEAFINFGYSGVAIFSFIVGRLVRLVIKTKEIALIAIVPLFLYNLFSAGLIGNLFSNGFILFFLIAKFVRFREGKPKENIKL